MSIRVQKNYYNLDAIQQTFFEHAIRSAVQFGKDTLLKKGIIINPPEAIRRVTLIKLHFYPLSDNPYSIGVKVAWYTAHNNVGNVHLLVDVYGRVHTCTTPENVPEAVCLA